MFDGEHIRQVRKGLGLTQKQLSEKFGIPIGSLRNWEQERCAPDAIAKTLLFLISEDPEKIEEMLKKYPPPQ